jgi:hypothetical protein
MNSNGHSDVWFSTSRKTHREFHSELDTLLRSLDRFFSMENLSIPHDHLSTRDFHVELRAAGDVIFRVLGIFEALIPENKKNAYWFQKFTEAKFLTDHSRDLYRGKLYKQDTAEKGVYILYDFFTHLKGLVTDLLQSEKISYLSYNNIGELISKEIRENHFLNPFSREINPEFDMIENSEIADVVRSIEGREMKKIVSLLYLHLFRFLRYLRHVNISSIYPIFLHASLMVLIMLRSEFVLFVSYAKKASEHAPDPGLKSLMQSLTYQFSMESKRVYLQELKDILQKNSPHHFRGAIENSHGILKNLIEQSILQITHFFRPEIRGENVFQGFTAKKFQSMKLHEDMTVLHRFIALILAQASFPEERKRIFDSMKIFMRYFESFTFKMLRYSDYDEFAAFFTSIYSFKESDWNKIIEKMHAFKIFLETTLRQIAHRAELDSVTSENKKAEEVFQHYLKYGGHT